MADKYALFYSVAFNSAPVMKNNVCIGGLVFPGFVFRSTKDTVSNIDTNSVKKKKKDLNRLKWFKCRNTQWCFRTLLAIQAPSWWVSLWKKGLHTELPGCSIHLVFRHVSP